MTAVELPMWFGCARVCVRVAGISWVGGGCLDERRQVHEPSSL